MATVHSLNATQKSVPMFIRGLAEDAGLKVVFGGDPGYLRDTHTIYLPPYATFSADRLATHASLNDMQKAVHELFLATGFHEFGHPLYTTPGFRNGGSDLADFLWNALEDVRCDSKQQVRFAGAKSIFNAGYGRLINMGFWTPADASDMDGLFSAWVLYRGRFELAGQACFEDLSKSADALLVSTAGRAFVDEAWSIVSKVKAAVHTKDVFAVVEELLDFLKRQSQSDPKSGKSGAGDPPPKSSGEDSTDGKPGANASPDQGNDPGKDQSQPASPSASSTSGSASATPPKAGQPDQGSHSGNSRAPGDPAKPGDSPSSSSPSDAPPSGAPSSWSPSLGAKKVASAALNAAQSQMPGDVGGVLSRVLNVATSDAIRAGAMPDSIARAAPALVSTAPYRGDRDTMPMTIKLRNLLLSQGHAATAHYRRGGRIDNRMLARVPLGERDVFVDEQPAHVVHTALKVIVDRSQSMQGCRIAIAKKAALRVCIAAGDIDGTNVSASAFPERLDGRSDQVRQLLPFGSQARMHAFNFLTLDAPDWATTPLAPALKLAMYELLRQPQPRKICLVATDGGPNGGGASEKLVIALMRRMGIRVLGLGIQTMRVTDLFDKYEVVQDLADLESAMFRLLQSQMLSRAAA